MVFFSRVALESTLYSAGDEEDLWLLEHVVEGRECLIPVPRLRCTSSRAVCFVVPAQAQASVYLTGTTFVRARPVAFACAPHGCPSGRRAVLLPGNFLTFQASCLVDLRGQPSTLLPQYPLEAFTQRSFSACSTNQKFVFLRGAN